MNKCCKKDRFPRRAGVTLMELVIAIAMVAILFAVVVPQFVIMGRSWDVKQGTAEAIQNGRVLMEHINRNLSKAVRITAVSESADTDGYVEFEDSAANTYRYEIGAGGYVEFGLLGGLEELAGPVGPLRFTCYSACDMATPLSPVTDTSVIRTVKVEATLTNQGSTGQDKTFTSWANLRSNGSNSQGLTNGTPFEYDTSNGQYPALVQIDADRYLCAYTDSSSAGYAVVLSVDPDTWTITRGAPVSLESPAAVGRFAALAQVDATHYLCVYAGDSIFNNYGYAEVLTVIGTVITRGARASLETPEASARFPDLAQIDSTHYLCSYSRGNAGNAVVLTVNTGTWTVTAGTRRQFIATGLYTALAQIDSTHYLCAYTGGGTDGFAVVLTVNTGAWTITDGTDFEFDTSQGQYPALAQIDSTHYLCAYTGPGTDGFAVVLIVTPGAWTVSRGSPYEFETTNCETPALAQIVDSARGRYGFVCCYRGSSNDAYGIVLNVDATGWSVSAETALQYDTDSLWPAVAKISDGSCTDDWHYITATAGPGNDGWAVVLNYTELKP